MRDGCSCKESCRRAAKTEPAQGPGRAGGPLAPAADRRGQRRAAAPADHRPESARQRGSGKPCAFLLLLPVAGLRTGGALTRRRQQELYSCVLDGQGVLVKTEIAAVDTRQMDFPATVSTAACDGVAVEHYIRPLEHDCADILK